MLESPIHLAATLLLFPTLMLADERSVAHTALALALGPERADS